MDKKGFNRSGFQSFDYLILISWMKQEARGEYTNVVTLQLKKSLRGLQKNGIS